MHLKPKPATLRSTESESSKIEILPPEISNPDCNTPGVLPTNEAQKESEVLQASIKAGSIAQIVVAIIAVLGLIYLLKVILVTTFTGILLAFVLEPIVAQFRRLHIPRSAGALIAVVVMVVVAGSLTYFFYDRAVNFATTLPQYSAEVRQALGKFRAQTAKIEESARSMMASKDSNKRGPVEVQESPGVVRLIFAGSGTLMELVLAVSFIPFLVYFMLTGKDHVHAATVQLFPKEHRITAHRTVAKISRMIRSFIVGNLLVGVINSLVSIILFWLLGIPYFYFLGVISGFVMLLPYLGIFLALLPPLAAGIGILSKGGAIAVILIVLITHLLSMNVLYPKIIGRRLRLNPLSVSLSLLFWTWIWGAMGLLLAVPLLAATKIICDHVEPLCGLGGWFGEYRERQHSGAKA